MNAINIIYPTKIGNTWVFTDKEKELRNEPFIGETNSVIDKMVEEILAYNVKKEGFQLIFSENPFPAWNYKVTHINADTFSGNWYEFMGEKFWLCNALMRYFDEVPKEIYIKIEPISN